MTSPPTALPRLPAIAIALGCALAAIALGCTLLLSCCTESPPGGTTARGQRLQDIEVPEINLPKDLGSKAFEHCKQIVSYGERYSGSRGADNATMYIRRTLKGLGLQPRSDRWRDDRAVRNDLPFTLHNVHVLIPGERPDRILIACHHDTKCTTGHSAPDQNFKFVGANDSGSGVGLLLALAEVLSKTKQRATYELVFFDGEESIPFGWVDNLALFGSRRYVAQYQVRIKTSPEGSRLRAMVLLDMVGSKTLMIDRETNSDRMLRAIIAGSAKTTGHRAKFMGKESPVNDDHMPFVDAGIPAVNLIGIDEYLRKGFWHTSKDTIDKVSADSLQIVGEVVLTALPVIEQKFLPK